MIDPKDNCPVDANADQSDIDGDGAGDACDADADGDGVPNANDLCQLVRNADQSDLDGDGVGDACDLCPDAAGDDGCGGCPCPRTPETPLACNGGTVVLAAPVNLPAASSAVRITAISSADAGNGGASEFVRVVVEGSALPDISGADCTPQSRSITVSAATFNAWIADGALDATAETGPDTDCFCTSLAYLSLAYSPDCGADLDGDGQGDCVDPDDDNDGVPDSADPFPRDPKEQGDSDGDGVGDNADPDDDNDGLGDLKDNCARAANFDQFDNDGDGEGDACDADDDNDGVLDALDACPFQPDPLQEDLDADGDGDACDLDDDNDGTLDDSDACPTEYGFCATAGVPGAGCPCPQSDLLPLACNGGVATEVFNLNPGDLQQAAGPILVVVGARADVDAGGTSEFVHVTIDDVAAPDITGPDCEWSNSAFTVPAHVYNSWIADGQLVVTASTGPDTDCTCENVYYFEFQGQFVDCGADTDADGQGDCIDRDDDGDGTPDVDDALPLVVNNGTLEGPGYPVATPDVEFAAFDFFQTASEGQLLRVSVRAPQKLPDGSTCFIGALPDLFTNAFQVVPVGTGTPLRVQISASAPPADVDGNGTVNSEDLSTVLSSWGMPSPVGRADGDLDEDGDVDGEDLAILLSGWTS